MFYLLNKEDNDKMGSFETKGQANAARKALGLHGWYVLEEYSEGEAKGKRKKVKK